MGFMDKAKNAFSANKDKGSDAIDQHGEKVGEGLDSSADFANDKTGGKYSDQIDSGADKTRDGLDNLDGEQDKDLG